MTNTISEEIFQESLEKLSIGLLNHYNSGKYRILCVIGAGASIGAQLPLANELKNKVFAKILGHISQDVLKSEIIDQYIDKLDGEVNLDSLPDIVSKLSFEEICSVGSRLIHLKRKIIEEICDSCTVNDNQPPLLCYELISHFLKHGFFDHIISFNFDNLLDSSLEDELGINGFNKILGDSNTPIISNLPIYAKLHGSIDSLESLKFTKKDYVSISKNLENLILDKMFNLYTKDSNQNVILIFVGFSCRDLQFQNLLRKVIKNIYQIYWIDTELPIQNIKDDYIKATLMEKSYFLDLKVYLARSIQTKDLLDHIFIDIWGKVEEIVEKYREIEDKDHLFLNDITLHNISRHLLLDYIFNRSTKIRVYNAMTRSIFELQLHALKTKGQFSSFHLAWLTRVNKYSDKLENKLKIIKELEKKKQISVKPKAKGYEDYLVNTFNLRNIKVDFEGADCPKYFIMSKKPVPKSKCTNILLEKILKSNEVEIGLETDPRNKWLFKKSEQIYSMIELHKKTLQLIDYQECITLKLICETGQYLWGEPFLKHLNGSNIKKIEVIIVNSDGVAPLYKKYAKDDAKNKLKNEFKEFNIKIYELSWWRHNRHITISIDTQNKPIEAIYFRRRLKSPIIHPVLLRDILDLKTAMKIFNNYKKKAIEESRIKK